MNINHDHIVAAKLASVSVSTSLLANIPAMDDATQLGQIATIIVSLISGIVSLVKLFKKKK